MGGQGRGSRLSLRHRKDQESGVLPMRQRNRIHSQHLLTAPHTAVWGGSWGPSGIARCPLGPRYPTCGPGLADPRARGGHLGEGPSVSHMRHTGRTSDSGACFSLSGRSWKASSRSRWRRGTTPPTSGPCGRSRTSWPAPPTQSSQHLPWVRGGAGELPGAEVVEVEEGKAQSEAAWLPPAYAVSAAAALTDLGELGRSQRDTCLCFWCCCDLKSPGGLRLMPRNRRAGGGGDLRENLVRVLLGAGGGWHRVTAMRDRAACVWSLHPHPS